MKLILKLFLIIMTGIIINAQNVYIPDLEFKSYLLSNTSINTNLDTAIQISEANSFTGTINIDGWNIVDLTGIEHFTSFTKLRCAWALVDSINLSNNSSIQQIDAFYSPYLTHVQANNCTSLNSIYASNCNISSLEVDSCNSLELLDICFNQLTTLDLSTCPSLNWLGCCTNQLTCLNVKNGNNYILTVFHIPYNPNLFCIEVDDPAWSTLNWTDIDANVYFSSDCSTGDKYIHNKVNNKLQIRPNPVNDYFIVSNCNQDITKKDISLYNISGIKQDVFVLKKDAGFWINCENLKPGSYTIKVLDQNETNEAKIIIK